MGAHAADRRPFYPAGPLRLLALLFCLVLPLWGAAAQEQAGENGAQATETAGADDRSLLFNPLAPPETSSPRQTLFSFLLDIHEASHLLESALERHEAEEGLFPSPEVEAQIAEVRRLLRHAADTFDLSEVPRATLRRVELESVLLLMEILNRLPPVDLELAPGERDVAEDPTITGYRLPGTEITISLDDSRSYPRRFLFDPETVRNLPAYYRQVKDLPKQDATRPDLYQAYSFSPGELLPTKWFWLIMALPQEFRIVYDDQAVWQWIALALVTALALFAAVLVLRRRRIRFGRSLRGRALGRLLTPVLLLAVGYLYGEALDGLINITGDLSWWIDIALDVCATFIAVWIVLVIADFVAEWIISSPNIGPDSLDASLLRVCFRIVSLLLGAVILAFGAYSVGLPVVGVVAGLGVGGFALALAVKPTLENFVGFVILYSDRPVRVGERCRLGDTDGVVESIGIRSTRLRAADGSRIVIQNSDFAQMRLVNLESRDRLELHEVLRLSPETDREQIADLLTAIQDCFRGEAKVASDDLHVTFRGIGAYSLDIEIDAQIETNDKEEFKEIRGALLLEVIRLVEKAGTHLAFLPTGLFPGAEGEGPDGGDRRKSSKAREKEEEEAWKKAQANIAQQRADLF